MARRSTARAAVFVFSVGFASAAKAQHFVGTAGVLVYLAALCAVVFVGQRFDIGAFADSIPRRSATALMIVTIMLLAAAFAVIYPHVTSGSDRDEALDLATRELLHGRYPYRHLVFATGALIHAGGGNPISPLPGELLLAAPFVWLGSGAWQTFFWLAAFFYVAAAMLGSHGRALLALWSMLILGPASVHEIMTGGDLLANSLWVFVLGALAVAASDGWMAVASATLFGVGLSSRAHFVLLLPVVFAVLGQRRGWRTAAVRCALTIGGFLAVTLPFYEHDPAGFSPLHMVGKLGVLDLGVPHTVAFVSVLGVLVASALLARRAETSDAGGLATSAIVLGVPVVVAVALACARHGVVGFAEYGWYAMSSTPFGVLAAMGWPRPRHP